MANKSLAKNKNRRFCHFDGGEITLETPLLKSSIFVELRVRFTSAVRYRSGLVPRNDKQDEKHSYENECPSPDRSGNPFAFFFKKQKIVTESGMSS